MVQPRHVERQNGNLGQAAVGQSLAQKADVIGGPAAAPGLGDDKRDAIGVVAAALDRVQQLSDDRDGRITYVVVDVAQAQLHRRRDTVGSSSAL